MRPKKLTVSLTSSGLLELHLRLHVNENWKVSNAGFLYLANQLIHQLFFLCFFFLFVCFFIELIVWGQVPRAGRKLKKKRMKWFGLTSEELFSTTTAAFMNNRRSAFHWQGSFGQDHCGGLAIHQDHYTVEHVRINKCDWLLIDYYYFACSRTSEFGVERCNWSDCLCQRSCTE